MTDCERLSDRMPELAMQRAAWTAGEAAHLASCADCQAEWELVLATRRLEARGPSVDVAGVAAGLQRRLAAERTAGRRNRWLWAVGSAAAAAALAFAVTGGPEPDPGPAPAVAVETEPLVPLPELEELESAQLDTLLRTLEGRFAEAGAADTAALGEDVDVELEWMLATWEG